MRTQPTEKWLRLHAAVADEKDNTTKFSVAGGKSRSKGAPYGISRLPRWLRVLVYPLTNSPTDAAIQHLTHK